MVHRTYRRLDEPPQLAGFSFVEWLCVIALGGAVFGVEKLLAIPTQPAISLFTFLVGGPAALIHFSESGRPSLLRLGRDAIGWLRRPRAYQPGPGRPRPLRIREPAPPREPRRQRRSRGRNRRRLQGQRGGR
jgi:hypothetical protein